MQDNHKTIQNQYKETDTKRNDHKDAEKQLTVQHATNMKRDQELPNGQRKRHRASTQDTANMTL